MAFLPAIPLQPALAAGVVGNGNPLSCDEAAFDAALAGGGLVTFNCGVPLHTIGLTTEKVITNDTEIDGAGMIVLDMANNDRHFYVPPVSTLTLKNIRLDNGDPGSDGGLIYNDGTVNATNVVFSAGDANGDGGGIYNNGGTVIATTSTFTTNLSDGDGGAVYNDGGTVTATGTTFVVNLANLGGNGGAIFNNGGIVNISDESLFNNNGGVQGGAIANWFGGTLTVTDSTFQSNDAADRGGVLSNRSSTASFTNSELIENTTLTESGGAIDNPEAGGIVNITSSDVVDNSTGNRGGAISNDGTVNITDSLFQGNSAPNNEGGAINHRSGATLNITRSTFVGNTTNDQGGAIYSQGTATIETSTFSGNTASLRGGAILNRDQMTIDNSTIAFNAAGLNGGGIRNSNAGNLTVTNTIIANNTGDDCANTATFTSGDYNLDSDGSCPFGMANDISGGNANLQPLADNGGNTETHLLGAGSDAIDAGPLTCASPDQRGEMRPRNGVCDIGAVEIVPPPDVCYNVYTGQLRRVTGGSCQPPYYLPVIFEEGPHYLCANLYTGGLSYSYGPTCPSYHIPIVMPDAAPLNVCLNFYTGAYRLKQGAQACSAGEVATTLQ